MVKKLYDQRPLLLFNIYVSYKCEHFVTVIYNARARRLRPLEQSVGAHMFKGNKCEANILQVVKD
jgi:hypothetical protein